jgi:membrane-bound lytic murein transglycosylase B
MISLSAHSGAWTSRKLWKNGACADLSHYAVTMNYPRYALRILPALAALMSCFILLSTPVEAGNKKTKASPAQPPMLQNPAVQAFIQDMSDRHGFDQAALSAEFANQRPNTQIIRIMAPAPTQLTPNWVAYRERFVNNRRISRGIQFWDAYADTLDKAALEYGVPPEIIVAIIGVETEYGRNMGNFNILNALASIGFYGERRREFFQSELEQYLLLARDNTMDLDTTRGSFAGALGIPQFMPSSQRRWGVDFDGNGKVDLIHSPVDAIGSVANFLKSHGWAKGETTVISVTPPDLLPAEFEKVDVKPGIRLAQYRDAGFRFASSDADRTLATLVTLTSPKAPTQTWLGFNNYYVITRYNRSAAYAMSVIDLGDAIRQARSTTADSTPANADATPSSR